MKTRIPIGTLLFLVICSCYWPTSVKITYEESVAVNCALIAGFPIDSMWITKTRNVTESYDSTRMLVDTSQTIIIVYEGTEPASSPRIDTLDPVQFDSVFPHDCYFGHDTIEANKTYSLWAHIVMADGKACTLSATTVVPDQVVIDSQKVFAYASKSFLDQFLQNPTATAKRLFEDETSSEQDMFVHAQDGDTVIYLPGDTALTIPYFFYPNIPVHGAEGIFLIQTWADSQWIFDTTLTPPLTPDSLYYPRGNRQRISGIPQDSLFGSIFTINAAIQFTGRNTFYVYAVDSTTFKYEVLSSQPGTPYTNVQSGYGFFGSATVDSVSYYVMAPTTATITLTDSLKTVLDSIKAYRDSLWEAN